MKKKPYQFDFTLSDIKEQKMLPKNEEIEKQVLGYFMKHQKDFEKYHKYVKPKGMFYSELHEKIFDVLAQKQSIGIFYRPEDIEAEFKAKNDKECGTYARMLVGFACLPSEILHLCLKLNEYWVQRTFYRMGHFVIKNAIDTEYDQLQLLGQVSDSTSKIFLHIAGMKERDLKDSSSELAAELIAIQNSPNGMLGVPSSMSAINKTIKGYRKGNLVIIAASTGEGKTTLALQDAHHSLKNNISVGYISLEMSTQELMLMMACSEMGVDTQDVLSGDCDMNKVNAVLNYVSKIEKMPLRITDKAGMTIGEIRAIARMWKDKFKIEQLFIDHIHLANGDIEYPNAEQKYTDIANKCKEIAKELEIPVIALAQLARKELSSARMHQVTDIKYAGGIEQAADVILMPFRPEHHNIPFWLKGGVDVPSKSLATIIVGKLRLLPKINIGCYFTGLAFTETEPNTNNEEVFNSPYNGLTDPNKPMVEPANSAFWDKN